jgi:hypothetical protein
MEADVEILDVNDEEARALLLSIDPLASFAQTQDQLHQRLLELTPTECPELAAAWQATADKHLAALAKQTPGVAMCREQYLVLVTCRDEKHQVEVLGRLTGEELECRALVS